MVPSVSHPESRSDHFRTERSIRRITRPLELDATLLVAEGEHVSKFVIRDHDSFRLTHVDDT